MPQDQELRELQSACAPDASCADRPCIRPVQPEDAPEVHAVLTACLPDVLPDRDRWLARWQWQYWDNPHRQGRPAGYVLADNARILGHLGVVYLPLRVGDMHVMGVVGADYAVCEEGLARAGVFAALELAERFFTDCRDCIVMATTANEKTGAVFGRYGCRPVNWTREFWRASTSLPQQVRTCCGGTHRVVRRALRSRHFGPLFTRMMVAGWKAMGQWPAIPIRRGCWLETTVPQLARDLGQLWESIWAGELSRAVKAESAHQHCLALHRSQAYLDWRYAHHPERDHIRVLVVRNAAGRPLGAAMLFREKRADRHIVYVEDLLVPRHDREVIRTLLCAALRLAHQGGAEYLMTSPGHLGIRDLYWELGFEDRARNAPAAVIAMPAAVTTGSPQPELMEDGLEFWHGMMF